MRNKLSLGGCVVKPFFLCHGWMMWHAHATEPMRDAKTGTSEDIFLCNDSRAGVVGMMPQCISFSYRRWATDG